MIPLPSMPYIVAIAAVVAGATGGWMFRGLVADKAIAKLEASISQERERYSKAAQEAEAKARKVEQQRVEELGKIEHDAAKRTRDLQIDAARARAAADSLRAHIARLAGSGSPASDSGVAVLGPSTEDAAPVLAVVLRESLERNLALAEFADAAHASGLACERAWGALK